MGNTVLYEVDDKIATITLNRPEALNSINRELKADLANVFERLDADNNAWVGIITGSGRAFCAGRDLKERAKDNEADIQAMATDSLSPDNFFLWHPPQKPLIAAVNGYALAGGWSIVQMCDLRIASEDAKLGITEARVGLLPPFAVQLNRLIPQAAVMELVLTAEPLPAIRLLEMGFLNRVVPANRLLDEARDLARIIVKNSPMTIRTFKELVKQSGDLTANQAAVLSIDMYDRLLASVDAKEGPLAFAEKRTPNWLGR